MEETEKIKERYEKRKRSDAVKKHDLNVIYNKHVLQERESRYEEIFKSHFHRLSDLSVLEIGAGGGTNIQFLKRVGFRKENIYANELLPERIESLKSILPSVNIYPGNALDINEREKFDIVFQSTVFTSILDRDFQRKLASQMIALTKPGGIVLWYDFIYNNPSNKDVRGVSRRSIQELFADSEIQFHSVTLAPPIGRRIGNLYPIVNKLFPFLRTHVIAVIPK